MTDQTTMGRVQSPDPRMPVDIALHPALLDDFVAWLNSRGLDLSPPSAWWSP